MGEKREQSTGSNYEKLIEEKVIERMSHISSEIAHDIRSPLQTIQNAIYLLQRTPDNEQLYTLVRQSLTYVTQILDDFRDYYNAHIIQIMDTDIEKIIDSAFYELEIPENITVARKVDKIDIISIDPKKMTLAVRKLIINAIQAMPNGGELGVNVFEENGIVKIMVSDTGIGISDEISEIIYTPFISNQKKGKGLGVPTVKRVIESHGGELSFTSEMGVGTVFTIFLPRYAVNL
jgi:two-component system sporulation sensor kinase B